MKRTSRRREHRQIIIARGDEVSVVHLRGWMVVLSVLVAVGVTFWLAASTAYVVFRDDVLAAMMSRQTRMQHAYEDRIATLRLQIDRVTSRQLLDQDAFGVRMEELMRRQAALEARAQTVQGVIDRARQSGLAPAGGAGRPQALAPSDAIVTGSAAGRAGERGTQVASQVAGRLEVIEASLGRMGRVQEEALVRLDARTREQESTIRAALAELGMRPEQVGGQRPRTMGGVGGPLLPLARTGDAEPDLFSLRSGQIRDAIDYVDRLRRGLSGLPLRRPVNEPDLSSPFGSRRDPFYGGWAHHSGLDFRGETGEPVHAAGAGSIEAAGRNGGYGLAVDIDHGNGLTTRYGHLSVILVREGQRVSAGQVIGRIGSTGRSTGPHLHWETRVNGDAVNPDRFMRVGQRLGVW